MTLCIYHANCPDGLASAAVVKYWHELNNQSIEFIPSPAGSRLPTQAADTNILYIVDCSFKRAELDELSTKLRLRVIDHHESARIELEGTPYSTFSMTRSGAVLTWLHFFPDDPIPQFLLYIEDRDLWNWAWPDAKQVLAGIDVGAYTEQRIPEFVSWLTQFPKAELVNVGKSILQYQAGLIQSAVKNSWEDWIDGIDKQQHKARVTNTQLQSEVCDALLKLYPEIELAVAYLDKDGKRYVSLRSRKGELDVSLIAKQQSGGGGHKSAAGFSFNTDSMRQVTP